MDECFDLPVSRATFERLQRHARPLIDTGDMVINRALDALEGGGLAAVPGVVPEETTAVANAGGEGTVAEMPPPADSGVEPEPEVESEEVRSLEWLLANEAPPDMQHTKIVDARVDGMLVPRPNWKSVKDLVLQAYVTKGLEVEGLQSLVSGGVMAGRSDDARYYYLEEAGLSVTAHDANASCRVVQAVSEAAGLTVVLTVEWRERQQAAYPGQRGRVVIEPEPTVPIRADAGAAAGQGAVDQPGLDDQVNPEGSPATEDEGGSDPWFEC